MKILYASELGPGSTAPMRASALRRLGHEVVFFDSAPYWPANSLVRKLVFRAMAGPGIGRLNRALLQRIQELGAECLWADKLLPLRPGTLDTLRQRGVRTVCYMIDNPFGPRRDPGWRLYFKCIPTFDLLCTQRDVSVTEYKQRGARDVIKIQTAFEPTMHFPPPAGWSDADRNREVSFIGTPYDNRAEFLTQLAASGVPVVISGSPRQWKRALSEDAFARLFREGELSDAAYREGIWRSKINLSFVTKSNQDEFTQKSFEIAGCGGFLLAERSQGHTERFIEGEEAVFFDSMEDCRAKILQYLPDAAARARIAAAGHARAVRDGYDNDSQMKRIMDRLQETSAGPRLQR